MAFAHKFSYNYTVNLPPLAVLDFLKQHGYRVVGTNTIEDTSVCVRNLHLSPQFFPLGILRYISVFNPGTQSTL